MDCARIEVRTCNRLYLVDVVPPRATAHLGHVVISGSLVQLPEGPLDVYPSVKNFSGRSKMNCWRSPPQVVEAALFAGPSHHRHMSSGHPTLHGT